MDNNYKFINLEINNGVAVICFNHPPINLLDIDLSQEINLATKSIEVLDDVIVVIFRSAVQNFYLAHVDINVFIESSTETHEVLHNLREVRDRLKNWDKISIGEIEGRASGGGSELLLAMDMRFAASGKTLISQPEVSLGFIPCKGGTYKLSQLIGKARALEMILGGAFFSSEMLEIYGVVNRTLMPVALKKFVNNLATNIANSPKYAVLAAKNAITQTTTSEDEAILNEQQLFDKVVSNKETQKRLHQFLENVGQDSESELKAGLNKR